MYVLYNNNNSSGYALAMYVPMYVLYVYGAKTSVKLFTSFTLLKVIWNKRLNTACQVRDEAAGRDAHHSEHMHH
jgi:hypothetical protein